MNRSWIMLALLSLLSVTGTLKAADDSVTVSVNLIVTTSEASSIGRAEYGYPTFCIQGCYMDGTHQIAGGFSLATWSRVTGIYEQQISELATGRDGRFCKAA